MKLTENFSLQEFLKSDTATSRGIKEQFNPPRDVIENLTATAEQLQSIRDGYNQYRISLGKPRIAIVITSGYRCPQLNKIVGGSATSAHLSGYAVDVIITIKGERASRQEFADFYEYISKNHVFDQLINEYHYKWIHIGYKKNVTEYRNMVFNIG